MMTMFEMKRNKDNDRPILMCASRISRYCARLPAPTIEEFWFSVALVGTCHWQRGASLIKSLVHALESMKTAALERSHAELEIPSSLAQRAYARKASSQFTSRRGYFPSFATGHTAALGDSY